MGVDRMGEIERWTLYIRDDEPRGSDSRIIVTTGEGDLTAHPRRRRVVVVPASQLAGAVEALGEVLDLAAEALDVPAGYALRLSRLREHVRVLREGQ
jgi:hypothetical protein